MAPAKASRLDPENPWPGLESFSEQDEAYFHGRDAETAELLRLVRRESVTVLFGGSGLGKTSLLNAGLFPALRDQGFVPVYVRVDFSDDGPTPVAQVLGALLTECAARRIDAPRPADSETLWEYFHKLDTEFWNERNRPVTPVIALDQLEEVFTLGQTNEGSRARAREFLVELGDLVENRAPRHLKAALDEDPELAQKFDFRKSDFKLTLSFREDYLAHIEGLRHQIPSLTYNRFRLTPMSGTEAHAVVVESGGHLVDEGVAAIIIGMAAGSGTVAHPPDPAEYPELEIDPALLSVICSELNGRRQRAGEPRITKQLISGAEHEILSDFYERSMQGRDPRLRIFVEDELLTDKGYRDSYARDDALDLPGISEADVDALVAGRLLRVDDRFGVQRLELTHDVLTKVVRDSRDSRKAREREAAAHARELAAARRQRRNVVYSALLAIGAVAVLAGAWYVYELRKSADELLRRAEATQLVTQAERFQDQRYDLSLLLNVEAARRAPTLDVRAGFLSRFLSHPHLEAFLAGSAALLAVAFDPGGRFIASASDAGTVQLWNASTRAAIGALAGNQRVVLGVAVSPDGETLAAAGEDATVTLWDVAQERRIATLEGHGERVLGVAFSPDGGTLASASYDGTVRLWDVAKHSSLAVLEAHTGPVLAVAYDPRGELIASAGDDHTVVLWDAATREPLTVLQGHEDRVLAVAFSGDGAMLASADGERQVKLWDTGSGEPVATLQGHEGAVRSVAFSRDGQRLATASDDRTVKLWDLAAPDAPLTFAGHRDSVKSVAFSPDGRLLASVGDDGNLILWDAAKRVAARTLKGHGDQVQDVAFSRDGTRIASAGDDGTVILWDRASGEPAAALDGHTRRVRAVAFSADGRRLISAGDDKAVIVWDLDERVPVARLETDGAILALAYSPDGKLLASGGRDKAVTLWDTRSAERIGRLEATDWVWAVGFSPDGKLLATAQKDRTVSLWDVGTRRLVTAHINHQDAVRDVAFSPDGKTLASASEDNTIVLWRVDARERQAVLTGHRNAVLGVAFGPDGKTLASASRDATVILWDVAVGKPLVTLAGHAKAVNGVAVSPDGATIASASQDETLMLWDWGLDTLAGEACRVANRNLGCSEWRQYMGSTPYRKTCDAAPAPAGCD